MTISINSNLAADSAANFMRVHQENLDKSLSRLSSGSKVDDPFNLISSDKFQELLIDIKNSENYFNYYLELDRVSQDEYVHKTQITRGFDERPNHLSPENHQIMYNNICVF